MENRRKYLLRGPVEVQLSALASSFETLSKHHKQFPKEIRDAYKVSAIKLREVMNEIIREDNQQIRKLNKLESLVESWDSINDKIINPTKNN